MKKYLLVLFLMFFSLSCVQTNQQIEKIKTNLPNSYSLYSSNYDYSAKWWETFEREELNSLMNDAFKNNFNLRQAFSRIKQAKFSLKKANAKFFPNANLSANSYEMKNSRENIPTVKTNNYSVGLEASYEIDLWGKISAQKSIAVLNFEATKEDLKTAYITISGDIATSYINIISIRKQKKLLNEQLKLYIELFDIIEARFRQSMASTLNLYQQKQAILAIKTQITSIEAQEKLYIRQLFLLLGKTKIDALRIKNNNFPQIKHIPDLGIPSDLLSMRPDIRKAGMHIKSSKLKISEAIANRLPKISITGSYKYSSEKTATLFDNWISNLAANILTPVFDAGLKRAEVKRAKAAFDEKLLQYKETVIKAFKEVEDCLIYEEKYKKEIKYLEEQIKTAENTFDEARQRYLNGMTEILSVLSEELNMLNYRLKYIQTKANFLISRINLHKSIGGSWTNKLKFKGL